MQNLQILLQQVIDVSGFDGLTEIYLLDLQNRQEVSFAYQNGQTVQPGIAFTAASTMKIPIMVSVFKRTDEPAPVEVSNQISLMIERSENDPADRLMENVLEGNLGPLTVTEDLNEMGFDNTFLAGYFYPGAPLLRRFETPANQRTDVSTDPDFYNQTTAIEMGVLLDDIYQCASKDGGALRAIYPDDITQAECQTMLDYLAKNRIGVLIQAGLPEGTQIAHKHGWITEVDGVIHTISDAGIVYSPGGNYVLVVFLYHPVQLVFDTANLLTAQLSSAVYNFYNLTIN
jgi:beta-lactamase class A